MSNAQTQRRSWSHENTLQTKPKRHEVSPTSSFESGTQPTSSPDDTSRNSAGSTSSSSGMNIMNWASFATDVEPLPTLPPRHSASTTFGDPANNSSAAASRTTKLVTPEAKQSASRKPDTTSKPKPLPEKDEEVGRATPSGSADTPSSTPPWYKRRCTYALLAVISLFALVGGICGALPGGSSGNNSSIDANFSKEQTLVGDVVNEKEGGSLSSLDDVVAGTPPDVIHNTQPPKPGHSAAAEQVFSVAPCSDDSTWYIALVDALGSVVPTPYGCSWVAEDPPANCKMNGVLLSSSTSSLNRIGENTNEILLNAEVACPVTCGICPESSPAESHGVNEVAGSPTRDHTSSTHSPSKTPVRVTREPSRKPSPRPTPAPAQTPWPTKRPTRLPTRRPTIRTTRPPTRRHLPNPTETKETGTPWSVEPNKFVCKSTAVDSTSETALPFFGARQVGTVDSTIIGEASGLVASTVNQDILWTHNDAPKRNWQPNRNKIYAISRYGGNIVGEYAVDGVKNIDWEDVAYGSGPIPGVKYIYIGDTGENPWSGRSPCFL